MIVGIDQYVVHVVDDDAEQRERLLSDLARAGFRTRTYGSGEDFLDTTDPEAGCVVLDMHLPGINGREVRRAITERGLAIKVIVATAFADVPLARAAFRDGVIDVLEKPLDSAALVSAVQRAFDTLLVESTRHERAEHAQELLARLTPRQREVLDLLVEGYISKQIAFKIGCSVRTVEAHRGQVMKRLEVTSLAELTRLYLDAASTPEQHTDEESTVHAS